MKCWDCGSTIKGHHTKLCDMAGKRDKRDLPAIEGTQWWTGAKRTKAGAPKREPRRLFNTLYVENEADAKAVMKALLKLKPQIPTLDWELSWEYLDAE